jgi:hypothetical protein
MWKANGKTTTLILFLHSLFPKVWKRLWTYSNTDYYLKNSQLNKHYAMKVYGGVDVYIHVFLTSALAGGE